MTVAQRPLDQPSPVAAGPVTRRAANHGSPGFLLHPGGPWTPPPSGHADLAALAALGAELDNLGRLRRRPRRWDVPAFATEVEHVRSQLRPIASREALADSYAREAGHPGLGAAVGAAYALAWLELGDGMARPSWSAWLDGDRR